MTDRTEVNLWLAAADADELVCQCGARKEIGHLSAKAKATTIVAFVRKHIGTCEINAALPDHPCSCVCHEMADPECPSRCACGRMAGDGSPSPSPDEVPNGE